MAARAFRAIKHMRTPQRSHAVGELANEASFSRSVGALDDDGRAGLVIHEVPQCEQTGEFPVPTDKVTIGGSAAVRCAAAALFDAREHCFEAIGKLRSQLILSASRELSQNFRSVSATPQRDESRRSGLHSFGVQRRDREQLSNRALGGIQPTFD
jgi:hypothetical protein